MQGWIDLFRSLGESLIEVLRAESAALQRELKESGRTFGIGLGLLGAAAVLLFWVVGLLIFVLVALLAVWLPLWGAALVVLALFALAAGALAALGLSRVRKAENPVDSVKRHVDDHLDWWQNSLLAQGRPLDIPASPAPATAEPLPNRDGDIS